MCLNWLDITVAFSNDFGMGLYVPTWPDITWCNCRHKLEWLWTAAKRCWHAGVTAKSVDMLLLHLWNVWEGPPWPRIVREVQTQSNSKMRLQPRIVLKWFELDCLVLGWLWNNLNKVYRISIRVESWHTYVKTQLKMCHAPLRHVISWGKNRLNRVKSCLNLCQKPVRMLLGGAVIVQAWFEI